MRRQFLFALVSLIVLVMAFPPAGKCARVESLYEWLLEKEHPIKTYVSDVTDSSGKAEECIALLKSDLKGMLATRKKISFVVVPDKAGADIIMDSDIVEFFWTDTDPVDEITGIGPILMDAAMKEHYGRLTVVFTITDAKNGREVWKRKMKATITGDDITPENSAEMLCGRMMKVLTKGAMNKRVRTNIVTSVHAR